MTLYNWSMIEKKNDDKEDDFVFSQKGFNIVYAGNIGIHQGLSKLSKGINRITEIRRDIYFHFFGNGTDFENLKGNHIYNGNVIFHGRVSSDEIGKYLQASDVLFIHLIKDPIYECIIPSKLQTYIEVGKPILAGIEGEARNFIVDNDLGITFESENVDEFIEATMNIVNYNHLKTEEIRERSLFLYKEKFSRKAGVNRIHNFIQSNHDY